MLPIGYSGLCLLLVDRKTTIYNILPGFLWQLFHKIFFLQAQRETIPRLSILSFINGIQ